MQALMTSPWIPVEWVAAHGLEVRGIWSLGRGCCGPMPLSAGVCAFAESVVRAPAGDADSLILFATSCDQLRRGFDALPDKHRHRSFLFSLPVRATEGSTEVSHRMFRGELERLGVFLVRHGGKAPSGAVLRSEMAQNQARRLAIEAALPNLDARATASRLAGVSERLRDESGGAISTFSGLPATATTRRWQSSEPPGVSGRPVSAGSIPYAVTERIPIAVIGGPLPRAQEAIFKQIESSGGRVVLNATENGEAQLIPVFDFSNASDPLDVLVNSYLTGMTAVFQRPNKRIYAWLERKLQEREPRGIVLWLFTGCDLWRAEAQTLREAFGLPVLVLETDGSDCIAPRDVTRIEAFLETLRCKA